jgi:peroxiredoxin
MVMKKRTVVTLFASAVLMLVLFGCIYWFGQQFVPMLADSVALDQGVAQAAIGKKAPYFDLPNTKGDHVRLSDFIGTPVVVVFWATWEGAAADQIQILDAYMAAHKDGTLAKIVIIDSQEEKSIVTAFLRRGGYQVETLYDVGGSVTDAYEARSLPMSFFVDSDGLVRSIFTGVMSGKTLGDKMETIL